MAPTPAHKAAPGRDDKALARQIAAIEEALDGAAEFIDLIKEAAAKAPLAKTMARLRARLKAAGDLADKAKAGKELAALKKEADKFADDAGYASRCEALLRDYRALHGKAAGLLAQAMLEVADLEPANLRAPAQAEQLRLRAELDRIEKMMVLKANPAMEALIPELETFLQKHMKLMTAGAAWMRSSYAPLVKRVDTALRQIPVDHCRKTLLAEMDLIEADTNNALAVSNIKALQKESVPRLQQLEQLAARIVATAPAVDRELARIAALVKGRNDAARPTQQLKAMIQVKATVWPSGATADDVQASLARFEADLARLAAEVKKLPAAASADKA